MPQLIYLDYNATTPVLDDVRSEVEKTLKEYWGNPSSSHLIGQRAKERLEWARRQVATLINSAPEEVVFTSGGTESNNMAIIGTALAYSARGKHLITSRIEHPSVLNPFIHLMEQGFEVDFVSPDKYGVVSAEKLATFIRSDTIFCSIMLANNETGALQPVDEIGKICHEKGIIFHTDAAQAVGKIPVDVSKIGCDLLTIAGHKLYAPKGIGALYVKKGTDMANILFGAGQEMGKRPGTEPVPGACGLGRATKVLKDKIDDETERQNQLRELLFKRLNSNFKDLIRFVPAEKSLPNTLAVSFPHISGATLLERIPNVMASTGAACHDRSTSVSHVLSAMGVEKQVALGMVRFSIGLFTTWEEIEIAAEQIIQAASKD